MVINVSKMVHGNVESLNVHGQFCVCTENYINGREDLIRLKRIITYLYEYQNGMRRGSAGVFKLDLLGEECRIQLNLQGSVTAEEQGTVYFVVKHGEGELTGVPVGETSRYRGSGGGNWMVRQNGICGSRYSFDDVHGMAVRYPSGRYLASCWEEKADERFLRGDFAEEKELTEKVDERPEAAGNSEMIENLEYIGNLGVVENLEVIEDDSDTVEEWKPDGNLETSKKTGKIIMKDGDRESAEKQEENTKTQEMAESSLKTGRDTGKLHAEELPGAASKETLQRMDISDIRSLPKKNWHLCSNSFLIHGFFSYHYLVRKDVEEDGVITSYLGVPGIYARPERAMAMLFGFPEFEEERRVPKNSIMKEQAVNGHRASEDKVRKDEEKEDRVREYKAEEHKESPAMETDGKNMKKPQIPEGSFGYWFCQLET